jgi:hypothetical protein
MRQGKVWVRAACVATLGCLATACSSGPDVVATSKPAAAVDPYLAVRTLSGCKAGRYSGLAITVATDGGPIVPFTGVIDFLLVESKKGDVLVLSDAKLMGTTTTGGGDFTADVVGGGGCSEGAFGAKLVEGVFPLGVLPDGGPSTVGFDGKIDGTYDAQGRSFSGTWSALLAFKPIGLPVGGNWVAVWRSAK